MANESIGLRLWHQKVNTIYGFGDNEWFIEDNGNYFHVNHNFYTRYLYARYRWNEFSVWLSDRVRKWKYKTKLYAGYRLGRIKFRRWKLKNFSLRYPK